jgi:hypothetical protein
MTHISFEQQIIEKLHRLDDAQKQRVLAFVERELAKAQVTLGDWLNQATAYRDGLRARYGDDHVFDVQTILDDIREEASWPRS